MPRKKVSRREFLQRSAAGSVALATMTPGLALGKSELSRQAARVNRHAIVASLGNTLIPTDPGDPGYQSLETYKITDEVMKGLEGVSDGDLEGFNKGSARIFSGRQFLQLTESQRADYLRLIIDGGKFSNKEQLKALQRVYRQVRTRVFSVFYQNYPENVTPRDENGVPILKPGDEHQITNPNTRRLVTGWDIAGFQGSLTWEEEEERRAQFKNIAWDK
jgi:hypothetical protein